MVCCNATIRPIRKNAELSPLVHEQAYVAILSQRPCTCQKKEEEVISGDRITVTLFPHQVVGYND